MKNFFFTSIFLLAGFLSFAQYNPPSIQWQICLGGTNGDVCNSIRQTYDHGYILAGLTGSNDGNVSGNHGSSDAWIVKLDSSGSIQWQRCYGGSDDDRAYSIIQTNDSGYCFVGESNSGDGDCLGNNNSGIYEWVVKLTSSGSVQWQTDFSYSAQALANSVLQINGGYIILGSENSGYDIRVTKLNSNGGIQWSIPYGGSGMDDPSCIRQTFDGGYIFVATTGSNDGDVSGNHDTANIYNMADYWLVKLGQTGNIQWQKCLGGTNGDLGSGVCQDFDGGFVATGCSLSNDGDVSGNHGAGDFWVVKVDPIGNLLWQNSFGGSANEGYSRIELNNDHGYLICGISKSNDGDVTGHHGSTAFYDYWLVKLDSLGLLQWEKSLGGNGDEGGVSGFNFFQQTLDGGYVIGGTTNSQNSGDVTSGHGGYDFWVLKLGPAVLSVNEQKDEEKHLIVYPNPSSGQFNVRLPQNTSCLEIYNSLGQLVEQRDVKGSDLESFEIGKPGVYMVRVTTDKQVISKEIVITN